MSIEREIERQTVAIEQLTVAIESLVQLNQRILEAMLDIEDDQPVRDMEGNPL